MVMMLENSERPTSGDMYRKVTRISRYALTLTFIIFSSTYLVNAAHFGVATHDLTIFSVLMTVCAILLTVGVNTGLSTVEPAWGWTSVNLRRVVLLLLCLSAVVLVVITAIEFRGSLKLPKEQWHIANMWLSGTVLLFVFYPATLAVRHRFERLWPCVLLPGVVMIVFNTMSDGQTEYLFPLVNSVLALLLMWIIRLVVWSYQTMGELNEARLAEKHIAIAEERLRFSRDLHDVVGQRLSAIALKSELAAKLALQSHERAVTEMLSVQDLAHQTLAETRQVVTGYRSADLSAEVHGAKSLLLSAQISCTLQGDIELVPETLANTFAWVVRESVTNVVRHSRADTCTISFDISEGKAILTVRNNGVDSHGVPDSFAEGNGIKGLRERLGMVDGDLSVVSHGGEFIVTASAPLGQGLNRHQASSGGSVS